MDARQYHDATAHSPHSVRTNAHSLEWDIKPFAFKVYTDVPAIELPRSFDPPAADTLEAIASMRDDTTPLDLERLAALLYLSAGVTRKKVYGPGVEVLFRAAASTGALYQTEVYVAAGDVRGLAPGSTTSVRAISRCDGCATSTRAPCSRAARRTRISPGEAWSSS